MNYYEFHIGDYRRDTSHLSLLEHGVYRQLLDSYYLHELPFPADHTSVYRAHNARTSDERAAVDIVLREFFTLTPDGYVHKRCKVVLEAWYEKSAKARAAIQARWDAHRAKLVAQQAASDTSVIRPYNGCNSTDIPPSYPVTQLPNNPEKKDQSQSQSQNTSAPQAAPKRVNGKFHPPDLQEVAAYCQERGNDVDPQAWLDHYTANGWKVGKSSMKDWRASVRTWERNQRGNGNATDRRPGEGRGARSSRIIREIAEQDIRENGFAQTLDGPRVRLPESAIPAAVDGRYRGDRAEGDPGVVEGAGWPDADRD